MPTRSDTIKSSRHKAEEILKKAKPVMVRSELMADSYLDFSPVSNEIPIVEGSCGPNVAGVCGPDMTDIID